MVRGLKMSGGKLALLAAAGVLVGGVLPAQSADLGGDCCADLEERIAELEATTARKGNRKVKLEISGHVNEAFLFWDDGFESNGQPYTNDNARSRFRLKGSATISDGVKAGYLIEIGVRSANSKRFDQNDPTGTPTGLDIRHTAWFLESKSLGTVWLGRTSGASDGITEVNLAATKDIAKYSDVEDTALGLGIRFSNGNIGTRFSGGVDELVSYRRLIQHSGDQPGEGDRENLIKYITPEFAGFTATAAWGGDDGWDIGMNYKGEFAGFKVAGGIAYGEVTYLGTEGGIIDECMSDDGASGGGLTSDIKCRQVGGSLSVMHEETGLYANFAAGWAEDELIDSPGVFTATGVGADPTSTFYAIEAGIEQKWMSFGKTTIFGQYYDFDGGSNDNRRLDFTATPGAGGDLRIGSSEIQSYTIGVVQGIDAAAMHVYACYRHFETDVTLLNGAGAAVADPGVEDLDVFLTGAMIKF